MGHHVHCPDTEHSPVHIKAVEHVVHVMILVLTVEKDFLLAILFQVFTGSYQETGCAACRVADDFICFRFHQIHHHTNDVSWCTELTVHACCCNLGKQIFVNITTSIRCFQLSHLLIDRIHCSNDFIQHQRSRNLENGISHILGVCTVFISVKVFDKREYPFLHCAVHLCCREIMENTPLQLTAVDGTVTDLNFFRKNAGIRKAEHSRFFGMKVIRIVKVADKHQVCHLFNDIKGIGKTAGPEYFPQAVNFTSQFSSNHNYSFSQFQA